MEVQFSITFYQHQDWDKFQDIKLQLMCEGWRWCPSENIKKANPIGGYDETFFFSRKWE